MTGLRGNKKIAMDIDKLVEEKTKYLTKNRILRFSDEELKNLRTDEAQHFIRTMERNILMRLPEDEIAFFEWLKENDPLIWDDIWDGEEDIYNVSLDLLSQFVGNKNGFPICDLIEQPNYWFVVEHIKPKGMEQVDAIFEKLEKGQALVGMELFLIEITQAPIDIWHFSYKYDLSIKAVKAMIDEMVYNGWITHLKSREDLVKYVDI